MKLFPKNKHLLFENILAVILAFVWNSIVYTGTKLVNATWSHRNITTSLDAHFPVLPWTVSIYFGCYLFWIFNYYLCANQNRAERDRFFCADALAKGCCLVTFLTVPTTLVRPTLAESENLWGYLMEFLYWVDTPNNLFPSIHCLISWLCWIGVRKRKDIPVLYRYFSLLAAIAVCISTLTTKQHVIVDVFSGIALAEVSYYVCGFPMIRGIYGKTFSSVLKFFRIKIEPR